MQPLIHITNGLLNVRRQFQFETDGTELPATGANNPSLCFTNSVQLQSPSEPPRSQQPTSQFPDQLVLLAMLSNISTPLHFLLTDQRTIQNITKLVFSITTLKFKI
jgi:hypothetical protein